MSRRPSSSPRTTAGWSEVHLCDNYRHLLYASADVAGRRRADGGPGPVILYIDDRLPLDDRLSDALSAATGARLVRVSDDGAIEEFARLPRQVPGIVRRNLSWSASGRPLRPRDWEPPFLAGDRFDVGYVYHPGFFLSKVVSGVCGTTVMRDSGYSNYVRHRVPPRRMLPRLLAGRSPRYQTWGEEPWVDAVEVARPDQLPPKARRKARQLTIQQLRDRLDPATAEAIARAFWGDVPLPAVAGRATALLLTQPLEQLGICSADDQRELYADVAARLAGLGYEVWIKPHPRERSAPEPRELPRTFPIEAWAWLDLPPFDLAVSLNSASLLDADSRIARDQVQLIPPDRFYARHWPEWRGRIDAVLDPIPPAAGPVSVGPLRDVSPPDDEPEPEEHAT